MQEGQEQDFEFSSNDIGDRATTEYFSRVEGGKKNKEKVTAKRTRFTRRTLFIIFGIVIGIVIIAAIILGVFGILNTHRIGKRTGDEITMDAAVIQQRAYEKAYETGKYEDGLVYFNNAMLDSIDAGADKEFIITALIYRAEYAYDAGGHNAAINNLLKIEESYELTDKQKLQMYIALAGLYSKNGDTANAEKYNEKYEEMIETVGENRDLLGGQGIEEEVDEE